MFENHVILTAPLGNHEITVETGKLARQASGAVVMRVGESMVLVTAVTGGHRAEANFFPLVVDYIEKMYAGGRIPGGFQRREGRLSDREVLISRLTDRPIRPLFPDGYKGDTQITATVISHDGENDTDVLCITGASAALMLSSAPFSGPIAGVRVGRIKGQLVANPPLSKLPECDINIVMACSADAIVMVEGEAAEATEEEMLDALDFGFQAVKPLLELQEELAAQAGKAKVPFVAPEPDKKLVARVRAVAEKALGDAYQIKVKQERYQAIAAAEKLTKATLAEEFPNSAAEVAHQLEELKYRLVRQRVLKTHRRIDGRGLRDIRPISIDVGPLPRAHGSAIFTRGETQALVALTLGTDRDAQLIENVTGKRDERFMLHYNFPPFSVGEIKPLRGPGRREVGHGFLAHRSIGQVLPEHAKFPYTLRLVSEILESNGSSSMATICGSSLALMDAGVPIRAAVAGIAMGLIMEGKQYVVLSDILGDEDHLGDMDFKVAGTSKGITGLQMDIKIGGLTREIMVRALEQAREGRLHILGKMNEAIVAPRAELKPCAPRITTIRISPDRIRDVIGSGGKTIRSIVERTGCQIDVNDSGEVKIASTDGERAKAAIDIIRALTAEPVPGEIYLGTVAKVAEFGAFVTILPGVDGLVHISELSERRVDRVEDVVREGDEVIVKCVGFERGGKIRLSRKEALGKSPTVAVARLDV